MSDNKNDIGRLAQELVTRSISEQARIAERYFQLASGFGRRELATQSLYDDYVRFVSQETSRYASNLTVLGLNYLNDWLTLNQRFSNGFLDILDRQVEAATEVKSTSLAPERAGKQAPKQGPKRNRKATKEEKAA